MSGQGTGASKGATRQGDEDKGPLETLEQAADKTAEAVKDAAAKLQPGSSQVGEVVVESESGQEKTVK